MVFPFIGFFISLLFISKFKKYENYNYIFWSVLGLCFISYIPGGIQNLGHSLLKGYVPFITLISSLYILASQLKLNCLMEPRPFYLALFLGIGGLFSNILGTTGASILLIYPLINILQYRRYKTHVILFFIFIISNCGGCLTPLGDPPLFMGYLKGVDFFWPLFHLIKPYIFIMVSLLLIFFIIDQKYYKKEKKMHQNFQLSMKGWPYLIFLIVTIVLSFTSYYILKLILFLILCFIIGRKINWHPITEVSKVFLVIFITLIPFEFALNFPLTLKPWHYFWLCGGLSAILDNAPTYLLFFKLACGDASLLMTDLSLYLKAISLSAVCMGALTYIGNAPNLMIKTIAEDHGIQMPSFLDYIKYALMIFGPILGIVFVVMFLIF